MTPSSASSRTSEAGKNLVTTTVLMSSAERPAAAQARVDALTHRRQPRAISSRRSLAHRVMLASAPGPRTCRQRRRRAGGSRGRPTPACSETCPATCTPSRSQLRASPRRRCPGRACPTRWWMPSPARGRRPPAAVGRDLVAATTDVRPDPGSDRPRPELAHRARRTAATTPAATPLRPAWAAPITPASGSASRTGTQSATRTISTRSVRSVTSASHCCRGPPVTVAATPTVAPCTCSMSARAAPGAKSASSRSRLRRDGVGIVLADQRQVEAVEGDSTDPVVPVGERQVDGAGAAAVEVHPWWMRPLLQEVRDVELVVVEGRVAGRALARCRLAAGPDARTLGTDGDRLPTRLAAGSGARRCSASARAAARVSSWVCGFGGLRGRGRRPGPPRDAWADHPRTLRRSP